MVVQLSTFYCNSVMLFSLQACRQDMKLVGLVASIDPDRDGVPDSAGDLARLKGRRSAEERRVRKGIDRQSVRQTDRQVEIGGDRWR